MGNDPRQFSPGASQQQYPPVPAPPFVLPSPVADEKDQRGGTTVLTQPRYPGPFPPGATNTPVPVTSQTPQPPPVPPVPAPTPAPPTPALTPPPAPPPPAQTPAHASTQQPNQAPRKTLEDYAAELLSRPIDSTSGVTPGEPSRPGNQAIVPYRFGGGQPPAQGAQAPLNLSASSLGGGPPSSTRPRAPIDRPKRTLQDYATELLGSRSGGKRGEPRRPGNQVVRPTRGQPLNLTQGAPSPLDIRNGPGLPNRLKPRFPGYPNLDSIGAIDRLPGNIFRR